MSITVGSSTITVNSGAVMADPPGTAPLFFCLAWVRFNMQGSPAINGNGGISSITNYSDGYFSVSFSTSMPDANYCTLFTIGNSAGFVANVAERHLSLGQATGSCEMQCANGGAIVDSEIVGMSFYR